VARYLKGGSSPLAVQEPPTTRMSRAQPRGKGQKSRASGATARSRQDGRGRIRVGDPADLAILDGDPLAVPDGVFASMPAATLVAAKFTYDGSSFL
jgi:hypothetical protein